MTRISTYGNYQSALLDLMRAQERQLDANQRVSSQKVATDLRGFGRGAETLTAMKSAQSRVQGFIDTGEAVSARLATQNLAMERMGEGVQGARTAIANALASGRLEGLVQEVQTYFQMVQDGLNSRHQGRYLFSGGLVNTPPVNTNAMADLSALPSAADAFDNDNLLTDTRLDEGTAIRTGFLANNLGLESFEIFRDIQVFHDATPLTGQLDAASEAFLKTAMTRLDEAYENITNNNARNGGMQNRVDAILTSQRAQRDSLAEIVGKRTDADMAAAVTDLEAAQIALRASAQVITGLRDTSLLNFLR
jgi:flagellar hook-associated protein 3 FlgL